MTPPTGYKLLEEGEEIKSGYLILARDNYWVKGAGLFIGWRWNEKGLRPMANLISEPVNNNLRNIVKAAFKLGAINEMYKMVPDYELVALNEKTGLDLDTLRKIRDIVQES